VNIPSDNCLLVQELDAQGATAYGRKTQEDMENA